jgi:hypothetical protein
MTTSRRRGQKLDGRRGEVFAVRVTREERARLEALQAQGGGPRRLGPWLLWSALHRGIAASGTVLPAQRAGAGSTGLGARAGNTASMAGSAGEVLPRQPTPIEDRLILDLCAGSGSWSKPYEEAGYHVVRVTLPESDVRAFVAPHGVWGVLAAPPCDQFSLARNGHPEKPRDLIAGLEVVGACIRVIQQASPVWWALENPVGLLSGYLGTPRDVFDPCDFGDPWTKRTAIWGSFRIPERGPYVKPLGGGPLCSICDPKRRRRTWCSKPEHRAITPAGFARAFFEANP